MYAYVGDNPTTLRDPTGLLAEGEETTCMKTSGSGACVGARDEEDSSDAATDVGQAQKSDQLPSWTPDKPLPKDPTGLGPDWKRDPGHKAPNDERYVNDKGDKLDWHKGIPGEPGEMGKDHWHWVPGGNKDKEHYHPGDRIKFRRQILGGISVGLTGYIMYRTIRMLPSLTPWTWETIPANAAIP